MACRQLHADVATGERVEKDERRSPAVQWIQVLLNVQNACTGRESMSTHCPIRTVCYLPACWLMDSCSYPVFEMLTNCVAMTEACALILIWLFWWARVVVIRYGYLNSCDTSILECKWRMFSSMFVCWCRRRDLLEISIDELLLSLIACSFHSPQPNLSLYVSAFCVDL